jgi:DNA polymerase-3 subunit epsilon
MRQIILDTETTGLEPRHGHKIIEIGCVELVDRKHTQNHFQRYINPHREIDSGAEQVHGISTEFLSDKPEFIKVVDDFLSFVKDAELVIHNAPFDIGFLDHELRLASQESGQDYGKMSDYCTVLDTLVVARKMHPGQKNSLDALCKRYLVDNSNRQLHGALLDSQILADVYLAMTGGQVNMFTAPGESRNSSAQEKIRRVKSGADALRVIKASNEELEAHESRLDSIDTTSGGSLWRKSNNQAE